MKAKDPYEVEFKKFDQTFGWLGSFWDRWASFWERWAESNFPISDDLKGWSRERFKPKQHEEKTL